MWNNWTNSLAAFALAALAASPAAARTFACPDGMGYDFAYSSPDFGAAPADGWDAAMRRADGASAAGAPRLSIRRGAMRCQYALPHGAFILLTRPFPDGADCEIRQDDYFDPPYFFCE